MNIAALLIHRNSMRLNLNVVEVILFFYFFLIPLILSIINNIFYIIIYLYLRSPYSSNFYYNCNTFYILFYKSLYNLSLYSPNFSLYVINAYFACYKCLNNDIYYYNFLFLNYNYFIRVSLFWFAWICCYILSYKSNKPN